MMGTAMILTYIRKVVDIASSSYPLLSVLLLLVLLPGSGRVTQGQRLPNRDEDHFQFQVKHKEVFYDTRLLPDGLEMKIYLRRNSTESFYFLVEEEGSPLSIQLSPCSTHLISWRLLFQDYSKDRSGDGQEDDEILRQGFNPQVNKKESHRYIIQQATLEGRMLTYKLAETIAGLYTLEFQAVTRDASIEVYASSSLAVRPHPELPVKSEVKVTQEHHHGITVSWKHSPTEVGHKEPIEYCVSINTRQNIESHCNALAYKFGDNSPELPAHVGFGFPNEKDRYKPLRIKPKPKFNIVYECVGRKTSYSTDGLAVGHRYYVDVYAINTKYNSSSTYAGSSVKLRSNRGKQASPIMDGMLYTAFLTSKEAKYFTFILSKRTKALYLAIQTCSEDVQLTILRNGHIFNSTLLSSNMEVLPYVDLRKGRYMIKIVPVRKRTVIRVAYSLDRLALPFPVLPSNSSIELTRNRTDCSTALVSWSIVPADQLYCVYVRKTKRTQSKNWCNTKRLRRKKYLAGCRHSTSSQESGELSQAINGLKPNRDYTITVFVAKQRTNWLPYGQIQTSSTSGQMC